MRARADHRRQVVETDRALPVETQACLGGQDAPDRPVYPVLREVAGGQGCLDPANRRDVVRRVQDHIVTGGHGARRGLAGRHQLRHGAHPHRVGEHETVEPQLVAQQALHDARAEGGGRGRRPIERRQLDVGRHYGVRSGGEAGPERDQFDPLESLARVIDDGQPEVGIDVRVAVAREMLDRGEHAAGPQPFDVRARERADPRRVLTERTNVDDRIARVVVDVDDRREVDVHAHRPGLGGRDAARLERKPRIARRTERHHVRKAGGALQPESGACLEIGRYEERLGSGRLQAVDQRRGVERLAEPGARIVRIEQDGGLRRAGPEQVQAADAVLADQGMQLVVDLAVAARVHRAEGRQQQLADLFVERQALQRCVHPAPRVGVEAAVVLPGNTP